MFHPYILSCDTDQSHRLHATDDVTYLITEVLVEFAVILLDATGLGMSHTGQEVILQAEDVCQYLVSLGGIGLLDLFQYDALKKEVACYVVDSFLQISFVCHSAYNFSFDE